MINNIFDSHAHYNDKKFDSVRCEILDLLPHKGIKNIINVGANIDESYQSVKIAKEYDYIFASVGVHPHEVEVLKSDYLVELERLAQKSKVVAIGEIGLDYHYDNVPKDIQKKSFEEQLLLAEKLKKPVIIHAREADKDVIDILKKYNLSGVVHCFSSSIETAKCLIEMGYYLGFTGVVTFKNAKRILDVIKYIPMNRLLIETDCPYMAPEPYRGSVCDSSMLIFVVQKIAEIKNVLPQQICDISYNNACDLFRIS